MSESNLKNLKPASLNVVLVCGGRTYSDLRTVCRILDEQHAEKEIDFIVHGAAKGADSLAETWAKSREVPYIGVPAKWSKYENAGPIRNTYMLCLPVAINLVVAFPGSKGTANMINQAKSHNIDVLEISYEQRKDSASN